MRSSVPRALPPVASPPAKAGPLGTGVLPAADEAEPDLEDAEAGLRGLSGDGEAEGPAPRVSAAGASGVWWVKNTEAPTQGHLIPAARGPIKSKSLESGARGKGLRGAGRGVRGRQEGAAAGEPRAGLGAKGGGCRPRAPRSPVSRPEGRSHIPGWPPPQRAAEAAPCHGPGAGGPTGRAGQGLPGETRRWVPGRLELPAALLRPAPASLAPAQLSLLDALLPHA